jgi:predicted nucleotidyltransferase
VVSRDELSALTSAVTSVRGVVAVFLFGSHAKGSAEAGSDVDVLVLFEDADAMRRRKRELFEAVAPLGLFVQLLVRTVEEFWTRTEPTFRQEILRHGRVLYLRHPVEEVFEPAAIVSFDLGALSHREKMRLGYRIRRLLERGGERLGRGSVLVGLEAFPALEALLQDFGASYRVTRAYLPSVRPSSPTR